ncbi:MAG: DUF1571 domain-containing protein [Proteobacteria bacterium]|nr:DUF1571 domain-containing protein [Pseudomonadota bacterium]
MLLLISTALALPPHDDAGQAFLDAVHRMEVAMRASSTQTYTLHKREWVDGEFTDEQTLHVRFRLPDEIVLTYSGKKEGRVVLYKGADWNDGELRVDPGPMLPVLNLDKDGAIAKDGERYGVMESRTLHVSTLVSRETERVRVHPVWVDEGVSTVRGERVHCFDTRAPKDEDPTLYAARTRVCFSEAHDLPVLVEVWNDEDGAMRMVEQYTFVDIDPSAGLTDRDFDPATYGM